MKSPPLLFQTCNLRRMTPSPTGEEITLRFAEVAADCRAIRSQRNLRRPAGSAPAPAPPQALGEPQATPFAAGLPPSRPLFSSQGPQSEWGWDSEPSQLCAAFLLLLLTGAAHLPAAFRASEARSPEQRWRSRAAGGGEEAAGGGRQGAAAAAASPPAAPRSLTALRGGHGHAPPFSSSPFLLLLFSSLQRCSPPAAALLPSRPRGGGELLAQAHAGGNLRTGAAVAPLTATCA